MCSAWCGWPSDGKWRRCGSARVAASSAGLAQVFFLHYELALRVTTCHVNTAWLHGTQRPPVQILTLQQAQGLAIHQKESASVFSRSIGSKQSDTIPAIGLCRRLFLGRRRRQAATQYEQGPFLRFKDEILPSVPIVSQVGNLGLH